jgi:hypothetical protein
MSKWIGAVIALALLLAPTAVWADGGFFPPQHPMEEPDQMALLSWQDGQETMLLQVSFAGQDPDFAWLVPLPAEPQVEEGPFGVFSDLQALTARLELRDEIWLSRDSGLEEKGVQLSAPTEAGTGVSVLQWKQVGLLETTVLTARKGWELEFWLTDHGYTVPPGAATLFDGYLQKGWVFLAMRVNVRPLLMEEGSPVEGLVQPLLLHFSSPEWVYPLRISALNGSPSQITLYLAGEHKAMVDGFGLDWANSLDTRDGGYPSLVSFWRMHLTSLPYLTRLGATMFPEQMTADLVIRQAASDEPFRRVVTYTSHWSALYLEAMASRFVLRAYPDGAVYPDRSCGRAEGTAMLGRLLQLSWALPAEPAFTDVAPGYWAAQEIGQAKAAGVVEGYPSGEFAPEEALTRAEWVTMLMRTIQTPTESETYDRTPLYFPDVNPGYWAFAVVQKAAQAGIVRGYPDGSFQPDGQITRAEVAATLSRVLLQMP